MTDGDLDRDFSEGDFDLDLDRECELRDDLDFVSASLLDVSNNGEGAGGVVAIRSSILSSFTDF